MDPEREKPFISDVELWQRAISETVATLLETHGINPTPRRVARLVANAKMHERSVSPRRVLRDWEVLQSLAAPLFYHLKDQLGQ
jgi:hypothetical protein